MRLGALGSGLLAGNAVRIMIDGKYIRIAIIEAVTLNQVKMHRQESVLSGEADLSKVVRVLATLLVPVIEYVARGQESRRGYYCLQFVCAIETGLILVDCTIQESEWQESAFCWLR